MSPRLIPPLCVSFLLILGSHLVTPLPAAQPPSVTSVFPLGMPRDEEIELAFTGNAELAEVTRLWSPQVHLDARPVPDSKGLRWNCRASSPKPLGYFDLYLISPSGISPPVRLELSDLPEVREEAPPAEDAGSQWAQAVTVPVVVNGTIDPGTDRDEYQFMLQRGQPLHLLFRSTSLGSHVAGSLTLLDPQGREVLHDDGRSAEPRLFFVAPEDGPYRVRVHERAYRKGEVTSYRLWMIDQPTVVSAFPHVLRRGARQTVTLHGHGLEDERSVDGSPSQFEQLEVAVMAPGNADEPDEQEGAFAHSVAHGFDYQHPGTVGFLRFGLSDETLVVEDEEKSNDPESAQALTLPADIAGRFERLRDQDWYRLDASQDDTLWIEALGERLGQEMDLELSIHDQSGNRLVTLSDTAAVPNRPDPWAAATLDPSGSWKVPADGRYRLIIRDLYGASLAGPDRQYRLRISHQPPLPTILVTESVYLQAGGQASLTIHRHGVLEEEQALKVRADNLPTGVSAEVVPLDAETTTASLVLSASKDAPPSIGSISLRAEITTGDDDSASHSIATHYVTPRDGFSIPLGSAGPILVVGEARETD